jgi:hypothetical protein
MLARLKVRCSTRATVMIGPLVKLSLLMLQAFATQGLECPYCKRGQVDIKWVVKGSVDLG